MKRAIHRVKRHRTAMLLSTLFLALIIAAPAAQQQPTSEMSFAFSWNEGSRLTVVEWWNAPSRAGCDYAANPWPQEELAAQRALVLGARHVLRDEWDISSWIADNRTESGEARIHGAETNCYQGHRDYPPHVQILYWYRDENGRHRSINSHHYPDAAGRLHRNFVIPSMCAQQGSYHVEADAWVDILDETCTAIWQQRYTSTGDLELRRNDSAPVYALRVRDINGDLSGVDVLSDGNVIYGIDIMEYDPITFRMVAIIKDYKNNRQTTETWTGVATSGTMLESHTTETTNLSEARAPLRIMCDPDTGPKLASYPTRG